MCYPSIPDVRVNYGDVFFASIPDGVGVNAIDANGWRAGPIAKLRFGRDDDGRGSYFAITGGSDALIGLGDVAAAVEVDGETRSRYPKALA